MTSSAYKLRVTGICLMFCVGFFLILCTLFFIQIVQHQFYVSLGEKQYHISITKHSERAEIFDRYGKPLALNKENISAFIMPKRVRNREQLSTFLQTSFPESYKKFTQKPAPSFLFIKRNLSKEELKTIEGAQIKDIHLLKEPHRYYPLTCASTVVGNTDIDNHGAFGIEYTYQEQLAGKPTTYTLEKDARSGYFYFAQETKVSGTEGSPVHLTLDATLQFLATYELEKTRTAFAAQEGAVLIMNPDNGDILAMARSPYYNPNNLVNLNFDHTKNIAVSDAYELGSVMKICVALAALEEGVVTPDELIDCKNTKSTTLYGRPISTWQAMGVIPFCEVIQRSNNIGIAQVAHRLGAKLYEHHQRVGFGKKTQVSLPGEQSGFINAPTNWSKQSLISLSFGYELTATLLQLGKLMCMIAHNGIMVQPRIIQTVPVTYESETPIYSPDTITAIKTMLIQTVEHGSGFRAKLPGYTIMGKTGSAYLATEGGYSKEDTIYTFAGIIEKDTFKRVIITFIKKPASTEHFASQITVPLFARVAERILMHESIFA